MLREVGGVEYLSKVTDLESWRQIRIRPLLMANWTSSAVPTENAARGPIGTSLSLRDFQPAEQAPKVGGPVQ